MENKEIKLPLHFYYLFGTEPTTLTRILCSYISLFWGQLEIFVLTFNFIHFSQKSKLLFKQFLDTFLRPFLPFFSYFGPFENHFLTFFAF